MRIARVLGKLTLSQKDPNLVPGSLLICEAVDIDALKTPTKYVPRKTPMADSLVVFDRLGATDGDLIALSEGREAAAPFGRQKVPLDAYSAAILETISIDM